MARIAVSWIACLALLGGIRSSAQAEEIVLSERWELFVDDYLIDALENVSHKLHHPERREVVLEGEMDWEDNTMFFTRVLQDGDTVRLYYRASMLGEGEDRLPVRAMAESSDGGITFTRPVFGVVEYNGSNENNILDISKIPTIPPPFIDTNPDCDPARRYKGLSGEWRECYAMASPDGIHWDVMSEQLLDMEGTFDTVNTAFWDPLIQKYRCFTRYFEGLGSDDNESDVLGAENRKIRAIQSSTSSDFLNWTPVQHHQYGDDHPFQLYTNATIPCPGAEHIYLAFPNRYVQDRIPRPGHQYPGVNDALFMSSRDCLHWHRFPEAWVRPGLDPLNWTERNNYPAWGIVETSATEWSMYISEHYRHETELPRLRRLSIRPRGFVSMHADYAGGEFTTKPFVFSGSRLRINFSTSAIGGIQIELQDASGKSIKGFSMKDMNPIYGDSLDQVVEWKGHSDLSGLSGNTIRMRISLKDADLFAIQFAE